MKASVLTKETILDIEKQPRDFPDFKTGDFIEVSQVVKEGGKERIQKFGGDVISFHNKGIATTFTVRKIGANSVGVERIYPYYSPIIKGIKLVRKGDVRRAKLFYIRKRVGKAAKIKEKIVSKSITNSKSKKSKVSKSDKTTK